MKLDARSSAPWFVLALLALLVAVPLHAQKTEAESGPDEFENSAGWGIDRTSGKIAIDPGLSYFYDSEKGTLVVGPDYAEDALADLGATDRGDGTWVLSDGTALNPIFGEAAIDFGYGPQEMYDAVSIPLVALENVELMKEASVNSKRRRWWRQCKNCDDFGCPLAGVCDANALFTNLSPPARVGSCKFKLFKNCTERWVPVCDITFFNCNGCTGGVAGTGTFDIWACNDC